MRGMGKHWLLGLLVVGAAPALARAQPIPFPPAAVTDPAGLAAAIPQIAREALKQYRDENRVTYLRNLFRLQSALGQYADASASIDAWLAERAKTTDADEPVARSIGLRLYLKARARVAAGQGSLEDALRQEFRARFAGFDDRAAVEAAGFLGNPPSAFHNTLTQMLRSHQGAQSLSLSDALDLIGMYDTTVAYDSLAPYLKSLMAEDDARRFVVQSDVLIQTPYGATLSAIVVRSKSAAGPQPAALFTTVQTDEAFELNAAKVATLHGYVGVSSDTRGKRLSPDDIVLYEEDAKDLYWVIDWISHQSWSNGKVGMYGGSNVGFEQWAAAKSLHPALKTIVPYCPENPGYGLPMQNNVFLTANYAVAFYLTDNKYLDEELYNDRNRWISQLWKWYGSGRPYRELDAVDGKPNKWLQRALQHPSYDRYWQQMTVYGKDYERLNIPVLAIDGYYDDGQSFAMLNLKEHYRHNPHAEHYLLIGPYDHFGTQSTVKPPVLRGYPIDAVAQMDTSAITFQWLDHVMRGGPKPALLQDRINFEVMGANEWRHAASLEKSHNEVLKFYLLDSKAGEYYRLSSHKPAHSGAIPQTVDFADRKTLSAPTYPNEILASTLDRSSGLYFVSEPLAAPVAVSGMFDAQLKLVANKRDLDIAMVLYEITPQGEFFHLAYTVQRASYAKDMTARHLLTPGRVETIPLERTLFVSRQLSKGSRLLVVLDVNKGPFAQINYGTGKDVSDESIADAKEPLQVEWRNDSVVHVPILK
jgi:uncharacterized protein